MSDEPTDEEKIAKLREEFELEFIEEFGAKTPVRDLNQEHVTAWIREWALDAINREQNK